MSKAVFDDIAAGLDEALAIAKGEKTLARLHVPAEIAVRAIRAKTRSSQTAFAARFGFTVDQIKAWEQGRHRPTGAARTLLLMIDQDPEAVALLAEAVVAVA